MHPTSALSPILISVYGWIRIPRSPPGNTPNARGGLCTREMRRTYERATIAYSRARHVRDPCVHWRSMLALRTDTDTARDTDGAVYLFHAAARILCGIRDALLDRGRFL